MVAFPPAEIYGVYDTPVRRIINDVARRVGLGFIVNTVINRHGEVTHCVAGDFVEAHKAGTRFCAEVHGVDLPQQADIVLVDSAGSDSDYWQAIKAMTPAGLAMRDGGVTIHICDCPEGVSDSHKDVLEYGYLPEREVLALEQNGRIDKSVAVHMVQASRVIADRGRGVIVTRGICADECRRLGFVPARDADEALHIAFGMVGGDAKVLVLKHAAEILPYVNGDNGRRFPLRPREEPAGRAS